MLENIVFLTTMLSLTAILGSSLLIFICMSLSSKLRTSVDIVFSQVILSTMMVTTVNWTYRSYLTSRRESRESTAVCLLISLFGMAGYIVVLVSYLLVAIMQLVIVKKGIQTFNKVFTRRVACAMSVVIWLLSAVTGGFIVVGNHGNGATYVYNPMQKNCGSKVLGSASFTKSIALSTAVWTFACLAATCICYVVIILTLRFQMKITQRPNHSSSGQNYSKHQLSSKTRQQLVKTVKRIIALMMVYMLALLPVGIITGLIVRSCTDGLRIYMHIARIFSLIGVAVFFPVYIISHRLHRKACYLLLSGRYKDIKYII